MQISMTARHCELSPEVRRFGASKLERLQKFANDIREARIIVTQEKSRFTAEITLRVHHHDTVITEHAHDAHGAIGMAIERLEEQLRRLHGRRVERRHDGDQVRGRIAPEPVSPADDDEFED